MKNFRMLALIVLTLVGVRAFPQTENTTISKPNSSDLSDGQISQVLLTVDKGEIQAAQLATSHSHSTDVKEFAQAMINQHQENSAKTKSLASANQFELKDSILNKTLEKDGTKANAKLNKASDFDKAYIKEQITMHEKALETLNNVLIPSAQNLKLHAHLDQTRTAVEEHLNHAKALQAKQ